MIDQAISKSASKRARKMAREPETSNTEVIQEAAGPAARTEPALPKPPSKTSLILGMLQRSEGASLEQMVEATGWLPHTTRAALTGLRKKGHTIERSKVGGETRYNIVPVEAQ